jgi:diguanylate cyclase (GGDEF)-like protein
VAFSFVSGAAVSAVPDDSSALLQQADLVKTSNQAEFAEILKRLADRGELLSTDQRLYLRYLKAWQLAYQGDYSAAIPELNSVMDASSDATLRFRAGVTAINMLAVASRYEEAYRRLNQLLDSLPNVPEKEAQVQGLGVAALLYNFAGQYDLALHFADRMVTEHASPTNICKGSYVMLEALYKSGKLLPDDRRYRDGISACNEAKEPVYGNLTRTYVANFDIDAGRVDDAIKLLKTNYDEAQHTNYRRLTSEFDSILARAYLKNSDLDQAQQYAQSAVEKAVKNEITKPLADAYQVLYEVAKQRGKFDDALGYHEKYAAADKGYLNDVGARTLAYQMVNQQVLDKKRQIDVLNEKNHVLQLQQEVDTKSKETERLYILLLVSGIAFIALWAYKTKRSQLHFMKLARRDGLTGIFNRQHFIEAATDLLRYCAKSSREACVVVIDLDHFKLVNDVHGHAAGDLVLKRAVRTCLSHLRSIDVFGRLGGEEFGIVLPDCSLDVAQHRAEELRTAIMDVSGSDARIEFPVSASFGIAATRTSGYDLRELLANADSALYEAKREGRNRIAVYQPATVASVTITEVTLSA